MPNADVDSNLDYFTVNYRKAEYADKLLDEKFITESFAQLDNSFDTLYANRFIFGTSRVATLQDGTTSTIVYNGLKQLIAKALSNAAISNIDSIDVLSTTALATNIQIASSVTPLDCYSQILNLMFKLGQLNTVFAFGSNLGTTPVF
jgi:hypothetical protein